MKVPSRFLRGEEAISISGARRHQLHPSDLPRWEQKQQNSKMRKDQAKVRSLPEHHPSHRDFPCAPRRYEAKAERCADVLAANSDAPPWGPLRHDFQQLESFPWRLVP